ncbi:MAG: hypothetical protein FWH18_06430 [Marinilabiliaceae bacterium]|nr:hypothetical protein [Marinilabiliaceae bacterium]
MKKDYLKQISETTISSIKTIDFLNLEISEYNKNYIKNLFPHIDYYFEIYTDVVSRLNIDNNSTDYIIDFGGGHGFLSLFLKQLRMNVIYCDHNPLSVKTITLIKNKIGYGPDIIIEGSSLELLLFCKNNNITPKYLIATDLIEHVYDLDKLFSTLNVLNPNLSMVFTTGSVKSNFLKTRKLRKIMIEEETESYLPARKKFISEKFPNLDTNVLNILTKQTRGLIYPDIKQFVEIYLKTNNMPVFEIDRYNTCDPKTGNWTERILSKKQFRKIFNKNGFQVTFENGFYNTNRSNVISTGIAKFANFIMRHFKIIGSKFNPLMILIVK